MKPRRIQLKRTRGWRKPDDVVNVSRPGPWGNPFVPEAGPGGWLLAVVGKARGDARVMDIARKINEGGALAHRAASVVMAVEAFRTLHDNELSRQSMRHHLQGKGVACWCKVGDPCHGDVVLEFANPSTPTTCGQSPADATAEKSDLSAPGAPRNAAPAAAGENSDPADPGLMAITAELEAMLKRGEVEKTADGKFKATGKFPKATEAEIDSMLDRRPKP